MAQLNLGHVKGANGAGVPAGGAAGQALIKQSAADMDTAWQNLYPVGAIYLSVSSASPAGLFGGDWTQITDRFLLACGAAYTAGATGGEAAHALTTDEMPAHSHSFNGQNLVATSSNPDGMITIVSSSGTTSVKYAGNWSTTSAGTGAAHNNLPPYLAVYVWKRVA